MTDIVLYRNPLSGHAHRAELFLSVLELPARRIDVDLRAGAQKHPDFLRKNPFGQVPVLEDGDVTIADSNAILVYLAGRYDKSGTWYPRDALAAARVQQWLSVAAGQLAGGPATARAVKVFGFPLDYARATAIAGQLFTVLDQTLAQQAFLTGPTPTIRRRRDVHLHRARAGRRPVARAVRQHPRMARARRGAAGLRADARAQPPAA